MDDITELTPDGNNSRETLEDTQSFLPEFETRKLPLEDLVETAVETKKAKVDAIWSRREDDAPTTSNAGTSTSNLEKSTTLLDLAERGDYEHILNTLTQPQTSAHVVHQRTDVGDTALHVAARRGHLKTAVVLLGLGAKVNASGHKLRSPLHCAAVQGHLDVVQRLLDAGAQIDAKDKDGATALDLAVSGNTHLVHLLIRKGARPSDKTVFRAAAGGHWCLIELFIQSWVPVDARDSEGNSLVVYAAKERRWNIVEMLLEKGASAIACGDPRCSALVIAAKEGEVDIVRLLLHKVASTNSIPVDIALCEAQSAAVVWAVFDIVPDTVRGQAGASALVQVGAEGRLEVMVALLEVGVDINSTDIMEFTALHGAARNGHTECVKELLWRGAHYGKKDISGNIPLHWAAKSGKTECVRVLVDAGANVEEKNKEGKTSADMTTSEAIRAILTRSQ